MEVGRRDFELGSASVFPAVRVEIDLEEWHTQRSACPTLSYTHFFLGGGGKFFKRFSRLHPYFLRELRQTEVLCNGMEHLGDSDLVKM